MIHFVLYDAEIGEIVSTGGAQAMTEAEVLERWPRPPGVSILFVTQPVTDQTAVWVQDGAIVERATMAPTVSAATIAADGIDACAIAGLPTPCLVAVSGAVTLAPTEVLDSAVTLTATTPGAITVRVTADPAYRAWETTIHAV